ncbi:H-type lectin domain-containing protein [Ostreiculturibacter nitratireducens]
MWTGGGARETRRRVAFSETYRNPPVVHVAMSMWDFDSAANQRADISSDCVTETGFEIVFRTWGDTRVARIRADWMAIGEVSGEGDWDV